jgi:hypothetical protein
MVQALVVLGLWVVTLTFATSPASGTSRNDGVALEHYLSEMSWPVRASVGRSASLRAALDGFLSIGDPPYLGGIAGACRNFRDVEARGRLLQVVPPAALRLPHASLVGAYSDLRARCVQARSTALGVRDAGDRFARSGKPGDKARWQRLEAAARTTLRQFERTTVAGFTDAARSWRSAVVRNAARLSVTVPAWLRTLPLG